MVQSELICYKPSPKSVLILCSFIFITDGSDNGLNPEQFEASVATLHLLAANIDADVVKLRERRAEKGQSAQFLIRKHIETTDFMEIR